MDRESYRSRLEKELEHMETGFRSHLGAFVGVNAGLAGIWAFTGAGFPWFLIPLFAWGIGLASNFDEYLRKRREVAEVHALEEATPAQIETHRKLSKARAGWRGHLVGSAGTSVLLFVINMITSPSFPWFLFPVGGMAIGLFSHYPAYRGKLIKLRRQLALPGPQAEPATGSSRSVETPGAPATAKELGDRILAEARSHQGLPQEEIESLLEDYLGRLGALEARKRELETLRDSLAPEEAKEEIARLEARMEEVGNQDHRREFRASIEQLERQLSMHAEIDQELELIQLRLSSALSSLRQLRVELARTKGDRGLEGLDSMEEFRRRSEELQRYLSDLRRAYEDLTP